MLSTKLKEAAGNSADATLYVNDVFSTWLYTGTGNSVTQRIASGIDLATKGGMVWVKNRTEATDHQIYDTARGEQKYIRSNTTDAEFNSGANQVQYKTSGWDAFEYTNTLNKVMTSWTFRKAAKFFDVVTYTGDGVAGRQIAHSLGVDPGMIVIKCTSYADNWYVYHRSIPLPNGIFLNLTAAAEDCSTRMNTAPTASVFTVQTDAMVNASGRTYVAYLFAHDTSSTGIIQCGSFTTDGSGSATVTLGYEPQWVMIKRSDASDDWIMLDVMRGMSFSTCLKLAANASSAEYNFGANQTYPNATGFTVNGTLSASGTYIYMAIRRPNKPPTSGTQVFASTGHNGTGATNDSITFDPVPYIDLTWIKSRNTAGTLWAWTDRLRGATKELDSSTSTAETTYANDVTSFAFMSASGQSIRLGSGASGNVNTSSYTYSDIGFKRAPGFFDEVCYTGTGSATTQAHNLGVAPELIIVDCRSNPRNWPVYTGNKTSYLYLNLTDSQVTADTVIWNNTAPTSTNFSLGTYSINNASTYTYVAYLFATLAGISKVGSYTGNGTGQAIACGFSAGARFVLIKRTDSTGDWYTFDSARGLTSGSSPYLLLNSTAAEVTGNNGVYASTGGFTLGATASTTTNISGASYIFLAVS